MTAMYAYQFKSYTQNIKQVVFFLIFIVVSKKAIVLGENNFTPISQKDNETQLGLEINENYSTTTADYYYDYYNQYDPSENFKIDSDHCNEKYNCSQSFYQTFPDKLCHCDKLCGLMNDCCGNYGYTSTVPLTKDQFECVPSYEIVKNIDYGVTMVTKCSPGWNHVSTKTLCEGEGTDDILLKLPVSDKTEFQVMFKNMYCAQCNFVNDFYYWKQEIMCRNVTGVRSLPEMKDCALFYITPTPEITKRICPLSQSVISNCSQSVEMHSYALEQDCANGVYAITYDELGMMYRNKHCAVCNGVVEESLFCEEMTELYTHSRATVAPRSSYSLRHLVDFNTGTVSRNEKGEKVRQCKDNEIYDGFTKKCREIYCAPPLIATNGVCNNTMQFLTAELVLVNDAIPFQPNCTLSKVDPSEYEFRNNSDTNVSELFMFAHQKVYSMEEFHRNGSDVFICLDKFQNCSQECEGTDIAFYSDVIESYLTLVGLVVSILALAITLAVYIAFPQLLNTPGKILVSLIVSLLLAQILFVTAAEVEYLHTLCVIMGVLVHYFFLAAFCWMNVIAFDLWMTFSNRFMTPVSDRKGQKRFIMYSFYAWLLPIAIVCTAVIVDFVDFDEQFYSLKPGYGNGVCWISSRNALILFFAGPLAIFKICDIISFISTAIHIARAKKQGAMATRKKNTCSFIVNLKLSLIMGLTWVFAFVANATNEASMWYLFIIFNSLQGLFIAICFLCTKKVGRLLSDKYHQVKTKTTSGTQVTSVS